jgi:hypothetical protein
MMETVRTSETSVYSNETTRRYIPEGSQLHTRRREKVETHALDLNVIPILFPTAQFSEKGESSMFCCHNGFTSRSLSLSFVTAKQKQASPLIKVKPLNFTTFVRIAIIMYNFLSFAFRG